MPLVPGANLGAYRIIEPLGRGGMASVFRAYEAGLDRYVALKVLPREFLHDETFAERFKREARTLAGLEHPNIVPIHAFGIEDGTPWMAMRLVTGGTLASLCRKGRLAPARMRAVLQGVADALDYAHARGVIHRDIKPQNVLLDDHERVYLADFGIARMVEGGTMLTQQGVITGTPQYMAPEQVSAGALDGRCDVYALGIITYELLTGHVPFSADTPVAVLMKHISEPIPLDPLADVPEPLMRAVLKAVAKKPADRFPTAGAFVAALAGSLSDASRPEPPPTIALAPDNTVRIGPTARLTPSAVTLGPPPAPPLPTARHEVPPRTAAPRATVPARFPASPPGHKSGLGLGAVAALVGGVGLLSLIALAGGYWLFGSRAPGGEMPGADQVGAPATAPNADAGPVSRSPTAPAAIPATAAPSATLPASAPATPPAPAERPRPSSSSTQPARPGPRTPAEGTLQSKGLVVPEQATSSRRGTGDEGRSATALAPSSETAPAFGSLRIAIEAERVVVGARALPLYVRAMVDGQARASAAILFSGRPPAGAAEDALRMSYVGRETVEIEGLALGAHQVVLLVGTERSLANAASGTADVTIRTGLNQMAASVRFAGPREREVRLR